jgi:phosphotransferase system IIB component
MLQQTEHIAAAMTASADVSQNSHCATQLVITNKQSLNVEPAIFSNNDVRSTAAACQVSGMSGSERVTTCVCIQSNRPH